MDANTVITILTILNGDSGTPYGLVPARVKSNGEWTKHPQNDIGDALHEEFYRYDPFQKE